MQGYVMVAQEISKVTTQDLESVTNLNKARGHFRYSSFIREWRKRIIFNQKTTWCKSYPKCLKQIFILCLMLIFEFCRQ